MQGPGELMLIIDQGGQSTRALVFDGSGRARAAASRRLSEHRRGDRVELSAARLWQSVVEVTEAVRRSLGRQAAQVRAAAMVTQRSTVVCWDRHSGRALSPVLSWQDRRGAAWIDRYQELAPEVERLTGLRLSPHYGASKLRWCLDHLPAVQKARRRGRLACGPLASFLTHRLSGGGAFVVDPANASRTLLFNPQSQDWNPDLLSLFWIDRQLLPRCVPTRADFGRMPWAQRDLPIRIVCGDQPAALFGNGEPEPDAAYVNIGTGAFVQRLIKHIPEDSRGLLSSVVYSDGAQTLRVLEGTVNGAASALTTVARQLRLNNPYPRLAQWLAGDQDGALFLNGISGLGSPYWRGQFRSRFIGAGTAAQKLIAVADSIVFLIEINLAVMDALTFPAKKIVVTGGLSRLDGICRRLADLGRRPVYRPAESEASARGAAFLLAGRPARWPETAAGTWFEPTPDRALRGRYRLWRDELERHLRA